MAIFLTTVTVCSAVVSVRAASQTWTNAPVSASWANPTNWNSDAVPGAINLTGNTTSADIATFTNPIPASLIGSASNPILVDDATITTNRSRQVSGIAFNGANCGAYVFSGTIPPVYPGDGILYVTHNGSITMNAPVTNTETFLLPILTRLPSSTAGIYNFVNNATTPRATMQIDSVTNDSANTRGTTFVLDGSNTGTNTIYEISQDGIYSSGISSITKQGTGTWVLPGNNSFRASAPMLIDNGLLIAQNAGSFGAALTVTVVSNAVLRVDAVTLNQTSVALNNGGTLLMNGSGTINGVTVGTAAGTSVTLATTNVTDVMTVGTAANQPTGGASTTVLHVAGPGTVLLNANANYAGKWSLDAGITQLGSKCRPGCRSQCEYRRGGRNWTRRRLPSAEVPTR